MVDDQSTNNPLAPTPILYIVLKVKTDVGSTSVSQYTLILLVERGDGYVSFYGFPSIYIASKILFASTTLETI